MIPAFPRGGKRNFLNFPCTINFYDLTSFANEVLEGIHRSSSVYPRIPNNEIVFNDYTGGNLYTLDKLLDEEEVADLQLSILSSGDESIRLKGKLKKSLEGIIELHLNNLHSRKVQGEPVIFYPADTIMHAGTRAYPIYAFLRRHEGQIYLQTEMCFS